MKDKTKTIYAKKSLGQNFLVDSTYIEKIVSSLNIQSGDTIIEIGPGRGALTRKLIETEARIIGIEFDSDLIPVLRDEFEKNENFTLIESDALKIDYSQFLSAEKKRIKLAANLPYYISTAILQKLIEQRDVFFELVLMLQREVADRITAPPETSERGYLTVLVEAFYQTEKLFDVPPGAFKPIPKIWSSVLRLKTRESSPITKAFADEQSFFQLVSAGFVQKRKTIFNNLKNAPPSLFQQNEQAKTIEEILKTAKIEKNRRAESLTFQEWINLFEAI